ncbi:hypothetical protein L228DRAFT_247371 [Xylona heveae TC161]|uniref:Uncharacterized protein n=1 Tax=Xylona heveae (strain CBS 132557 / TC161) TaxID=1328760 RepID=A0A165H3U2_XYLHT|nr:hypothetical protein L228DRAFT_247371 [Xylona heveae TC161]KZF22948.1 hypothetical protein L228DRAFT_247371 [Xylona heveae TC161]
MRGFAASTIPSVSFSTTQKDKETPNSRNSKQRKKQPPLPWSLTPRGGGTTSTPQTRVA